MCRVIALSNTDFRSELPFWVSAGATFFIDKVDKVNDFSIAVVVFTSFIAFGEKF